MTIFQKKNYFFDEAIYLYVEQNEILVLNPVVISYGYERHNLGL